MANRLKILTDANGILSGGKTGGQTLYGGIAQTEQLTLIGNVATASGTNIVGGDVNIKAQPGTGTGVSSLHFFTGTTLGTGSTLQTSSEKMTILGSGNVGIGTTTPGEKLDVNGGIYIRGTNSLAFADYGGGWFMQDGTWIRSSSSKSIWLGSGFLGSEGGLTVGYGGASPPSGGAIIAGSVGIGTTSPVNNLQIGSLASAGTATPVTLSLGGTYSSTAGSNPKLKLWDSGSTAYGFGVSGSQLDVVTGEATGRIAFFPGQSATPLVIFRADGNVGIGTTAPNYKLEIGSDSAGKPGLGGLWTVVSDERIKTGIQLADLDRCYEIVKSIPLKYFGWADGVYTDEQVKDRHGLGWIAQDVQAVFPKSVNTVPFTKKIDTGKTEEYEEIIDEKSVTKTRPIIKEEVIEDCLDLNSGQIIAALFGAVQKLQEKIERLEKGV